MSKILRINEEPIAVWLHEGAKGEFTTSQQTGESELKLRVNGDKAGNIIYLPIEGQEALAKCGARPNDWVSLWKERVGRNIIWRAQVIDNPNPNRNTITTQPRQQRQPEDTATRPEAKVMAGALCTAIDAVTIAEDYADQKGRSLHFDTASIRAIANTLYIQACEIRSAQRTEAA